jgi:hypothetical protein
MPGSLVALRSLLCHCFIYAAGSDHQCVSGQARDRSLSNVFSEQQTGSKLHRLQQTMCEGEHYFSLQGSTDTCMPPGPLP